MYLSCTHFDQIYNHTEPLTLYPQSLFFVLKKKVPGYKTIAGNGVPERASYILTTSFTSFPSFFHRVKLPVPLYDGSHFINCTFLGVGLARLINNKLSHHCMQCLCKFITAVIYVGSAFTVWPIFFQIKSGWSLHHNCPR